MLHPTTLLSLLNTNTNTNHPRISVFDSFILSQKTVKMRFVLAASIFAAAVSAGIYQTKSENGSVVMTTSTVYSTTTSTILSCASTVTNCPAHPELQTETQTVTSVIAVSTTVCPVTASMSSSSAAPIKQSTYSKSFPVSPVSVSTCPTVTETCTVTVTAECKSSVYSHPSGYGKPTGTG